MCYPLVHFINSFIFKKKIRVMAPPASVRVGGFLTPWQWVRRTPLRYIVMTLAHRSRRWWAGGIVTRKSLVDCWQWASGRARSLEGQVLWSLKEDNRIKWKNWYSPAPVTTATSNCKPVPGDLHKQDSLVGVFHALFHLIILHRCLHFSPFHWDDQVLKK